MKKLSLLLIFVFAIFFSQYCSAQRFPFFNLKVENGLVQSQATCLAQDKFGNLWVGTLGGLSRYDGKKMFNYTVSDGLNSNTILDIYFLKNGNLLVASAKGLQQFNGRNFTELLDVNNNKLNRVSQICADDHSTIFLLKDGKIFHKKADEKNFSSIHSPHFFSTISFTQGKLKAAGEKGSLYTLDKTNRFFEDSVSSSDSFLVVLKTYEDSKQRVWALCNKGLFILNNGKIEPYRINGNAVLQTPLLSMAEGKNGQLWFAGTNGAYRLIDTSISWFNQKSGLTNNIIYEIISDKEGNIWMSSDGEGVFRYSGGPFISWDESFGLLNKQVTGISGDNNGTVFFSSYQGLISKFSFENGITNIPTSELTHEVITGIVWQHNKGLWIGTRNSGLYRLVNGKLAKFNTAEFGKDIKHISAMYLDRNGVLCVGLKRDMLCIKEGKASFIKLNESSPVCFAGIGNDSLLVSTQNGFLIVNQGMANSWIRNNIVDSIAAQCMVFQGGKLFIGTSEMGIVILDIKKNTVQILNSKNGLSSDFVYNLIKDNEGNIWTGTGMGICRIKMEGEKVAIKTFGKANGIIGMESNSNATFADSSGHLWFGTTEGVSCYFSSAKPTVPHPVSIVLESVKLFGGKKIDSVYYSGTKPWYAVPENLDLPYRYNNLSFAFQAITLSPADRIYYRYFLEGSGTNWSEWSEENTINFSGLEPGNYTLKVMCKVNDSIQNGTSLVYSFHIKTPFHKSIWFVVSIIGLAVLLGVYLQYSANKRKSKRKQREDNLRKEEQSRVRERTAEDFHDEVGNKLTRINVLTSVLKSKIEAPNPDAERIIQQIQDNSQQLYAGTRDILWSLQPSNDNLFEILNHVRDLALELLSETEVDFSISGNDERLKEYKMPLDKSRNFIMIWKEALNNCMKYSGAKNVLLQVMKLNDNEIQIRLVDDGVGFDVKNAHQGNGLKNMYSRALRLEATFEILSAHNVGTQVILNLPIVN